MFRRSSKSILFVLMFLLTALVLAACSSVGTDEREVKTDSNKGIEVNSPGTTRFSLYAPPTGYETIDVSRRQRHWEDPDMITADTQFIGYKVAFDIGRVTEENALINAFNNNNLVMTSDDEMNRRVDDAAASTAKIITPLLTLAQMQGREAIEPERLVFILDTLNITDTQLANAGGGSDLVAGMIQILANRELNPVGIQVYNVQIVNIKPSDSFIALQNRLTEIEQELINQNAEQANDIDEANHAIEYAAKETELLQAIAEREAAIRQIQGETFQQYPELLEIERARLLAEAMDGANVINFGSEGMGLIIEPPPAAAPAE